MAKRALTDGEDSVDEMPASPSAHNQCVAVRRCMGVILLAWWQEKTETIGGLLWITCTTAAVLTWAYTYSTRAVPVCVCVSAECVDTVMTV